MPPKTNEGYVEEFANLIGCDYTGENATECNWLRTLLTTKDKEREEAVAEERKFLTSLYITSPSIEPENYSDSVTELECFQDGFDDAKAQIESKIRDRIHTLTKTPAIASTVSSPHTQYLRPE